MRNSLNRPQSIALIVDKWIKNLIQHKHISISNQCILVNESIIDFEIRFRRMLKKYHTYKHICKGKKKLIKQEQEGNRIKSYASKPLFFFSETLNKTLTYIVLVTFNWSRHSLNDAGWPNILTLACPDGDKTDHLFNLTCFRMSRIIEE